MEFDILKKPFMDFSSHNKNEVLVYKRAENNDEKFTSQKYLLQKKRCNYVVSWDNNFKFGKIKYFIEKENEIYAIINEYIKNYLDNSIIVPAYNVDFSNILIPIRPTICIQAIPLTQIKKAFMVENYICIPPNSIERRRMIKVYDLIFLLANLIFSSITFIY